MKTLNHKITNNFNNEVFYTSLSGNDLKAEVRTEAIKHGKQITDFKIEKL